MGSKSTKRLFLMIFGVYWVGTTFDYLDPFLDSLCNSAFKNKDPKGMFSALSGRRAFYRIDPNLKSLLINQIFSTIS
jgi:hypothetical protein